MSAPEWQLDTRKIRIIVTVTKPYDYVWFCYTLYDADGNQLETSDYISEREYHFTGLTSGIKYTVRLDYKDSYGDEDYEIKTALLGGIQQWSWKASNGEANSATTKTAEEAISNHGTTRSFSHLVWNDLVNKVNECKHAQSTQWNNQYATYSNTLMDENDTSLTAVRFNSLRHNIDMHQNTDISRVERGDIVYGSYFFKLSDALNDWIDSINSN